MKTILVVDDQQEIRDLVEVTLRVSDFKILKASTGEEAINLAKKENPDLIIMDIMMPGRIDGLEATRILKADEKTKNCTILMLTAKGQKIDLEAGDIAGADEYFVKPFSPLELIRKVEKILE
ncbi:MAG: response regulator [Candidatus Aminicenantes bacterium]|nr:response regulator [Candidatus Aminicenantes bacterium]